MSDQSDKSVTQHVLRCHFWSRGPLPASERWLPHGAQNQSSISARMEEETFYTGVAVSGQCTPAD
jgi:hypothetical protein